MARNLFHSCEVYAIKVCSRKRVGRMESFTGQVPWVGIKFLNHETMKTTVVLLLVLWLTGSLIVGAQSRFPIKSTSVWRINYEFPRYEWTTHANGDEEYKYFIGGDTLVSGTRYFKLMKSGVLFLDTPFRVENKYVGAIRDRDNKFYFLKKGSSSETLLYDFDAPVGGYIADQDGALRQISNIEVLNSGRKKYTFDFITDGGNKATLDLSNEFTDDAEDYVRGAIALVLQSAENQVY